MEKFLISDGSDLLSDAAAWRGGYISRLEKKYGCELRFSHIDEAAARALSRREGDYCTVTGSAAARALAYAMRRLREAQRCWSRGLAIRLLSPTRSAQML